MLIRTVIEAAAAVVWQRVRRNRTCTRSPTSGSLCCKPCSSRDSCTPLARAPMPRQQCDPCRNVSNADPAHLSTFGSVFFRPLLQARKYSSEQDPLMQATRAFLLTNNALKRPEAKDILRQMVFSRTLVILASIRFALQPTLALTCSADTSPTNDNRSTCCD